MKSREHLVVPPHLAVEIVAEVEPKAPVLPESQASPEVTVISSVDPVVEASPEAEDLRAKARACATIEALNLTWKDSARARELLSTVELEAVKKT
jgi:hypothetical protein